MTPSTTAEDCAIAGHIRSHLWAGPATGFCGCVAGPKSLGRGFYDRLSVCMRFSAHAPLGLADLGTAGLELAAGALR